MKKRTLEITKTFVERVEDAKKHIKMLEDGEKQLFSMFKGWDINLIECLLVHRFLPAAKRRAKLP